MLRGQAHVADLGHARIALGPAVPKHHDAGLVDVERLVAFAIVKTASPTLCYRNGFLTSAITIKPLAVATWRFGDKMSSR